jgi:hypothetical protein
MKAFICALLALLVGLVLGGWGPKSDLRKTREEINRLKSQPSQRASNAGLDGIATMLRIPERRTTLRSGSTETTPPTAPGAAAAGTATNAGESRPQRRLHRHGTGRGAEDEDRPELRTLRDRIQTASDVWKTRADLVRSAFLANVTTSSVQAGQFDLAVADMNLRLGDAIRSWVDTIQEDNAFTPETGIRMMNALSAELVQTYDQLDDVLPENWRARAGEKFQLFDLIDPQVAMPLVEIEETVRLAHE